MRKASLHINPLRHTRLMNRTNLAAILLLVAVCLVYGQIHAHEFVDFDDPLYVTSNRYLAQGFGIQGLRWALTNTHAFLWQPVTWLSYMLDFALYGRESARPWLLTNLALHCANVLLLFGLLVRWTSRFWPSLVVAALFGLHPIQVESVAWVSARKEVLAGLFFLVTLWAYADYVQTRSWRRYLLVVTGMLLCLASKGTHVALPLALLLLDIWPLDRWPETATTTRRDRRADISRLVREKLPLLALSLVSISVGLVFAAGAENVWVTDPPLLTRLATLPSNLIGYLDRIFWPTGLAIVYPNPLQAGHPHASPLWVGLSSLLLIGISGGLFALGKRARPALVGWLFFIVMLFPTLGLVPAGLRSPHDRYLYIPIIGILVALVFGSAESWPKAPRLRMWGPIVGSLVIFVCATMSYVQVGYWRDSRSLFDHSLNVTAGNAIVYFSRGTAFGHAGEFQQAESDFRRTLEIHPEHAGAHSSLGYLLGEAGQLDEAVRHLEAAHRIRPRWATASVNLANVMIRQGRIDEGMALLQETIREWPRSTTAGYWYAYHLEALGRLDTARQAYQAVLEIDPNHRWAKSRLSRLQQSGGDPGR